MDSLEKLSEMVAVVKGKKDGFLSGMKQQAVDLQELEGCFEKVLEGIEGCFAEIQSKEEKSGEEKVGGSCVDGFQEKPFELAQRNHEAEAESELNSREKELEEMERVLEERQIVMFSEEAKMKERLSLLVKKEDQIDRKMKMLEMRSFEFDSKQRILLKREKAVRSEADRVNMKKSELNLKESRLEELSEELEAKERMLERKMKFIAGEQEASSSLRMNDRKRSVQSILKSKEICDVNDDIEMVGSSFPDVKRVCVKLEGRFHPHDHSYPGFGRNVLVNQRHPDGLPFVVTMAPVHEERDCLTVPAKFVGVYDLSEKESVILISDKGSFKLHVKRFEDPRRIKSTHVIFRRGWRSFYSINNLRIGMVCLFRVKEHQVDGDASTFSMNVSILSD